MSSCCCPVFSDPVVRFEILQELHMLPGFPLFVRSLLSRLKKSYSDDTDDHVKDLCSFSQFSDEVGCHVP